MSKSYYKYPAIKDYGRGYSNWSKRQASKAVRRRKDIDNGRAYKKVYDSYNINDYKWAYIYDESLLDGWYADKPYKLAKKSLVKCFRRISIQCIMNVEEDIYV